MTLNCCCLMERATQSSRHSSTQGGLTLRLTTRFSKNNSFSRTPAAVWLNYGTYRRHKGIAYRCGVAPAGRPHGDLFRPEHLVHRSSPCSAVSVNFWSPDGGKSTPRVIELLRAAPITAGTAQCSHPALSPFEPAPHVADRRRTDAGAIISPARGFQQAPSQHGIERWCRGRVLCQGTLRRSSRAG